MQQIPNIFDERLAELVGILLGDGCISNTYQNRIEITLNKMEIEYAEYIAKLFKKLFGIQAKIKFRKKENALDILIFKKAIIDFFIKELGMVASPKWNRAKIPKIYLNNNLSKFVLRGYFDTDGSVVLAKRANGTIYPRLEMKICPSPMRNQLINILKENKFRFGAYSIDNNRTRLQMNGKKQVKKWLKEIGIRNNFQLEKMSRVAGPGFEPGTFPPDF